jgi:hypothetical protein
MARATGIKLDGKDNNSFGDYPCGDCYFYPVQ